MDTKIISLKIRDGEPLLVLKPRLTAESRMFRYLIDELNYSELEMDDFSPEAVNLFITILLEEFQRTILIKHDLFRDTHKLAVVFEVDWIKSDCQNLLREEMKSIKSDEDICFLFDECYFILTKWKERSLIDSLISCLMPKENSTFIFKYMSDLRKLELGKLDILLTLGGSNTDLFLKIVQKNLEKSNHLDERVKHLLEKLNLAFCYEQSMELYLTVFDTISDLSEISLSDMQFTHHLRSKTARIVSSRDRRIRNQEGVKTKNKKKPKSKKKKPEIEITENIVSDEMLLQKLTMQLKKKTLSDIVMLVSEIRVTSMYMVVDIILDFYSNVTVDKPKTKFVTDLETICSNKPLNKISRQYLDIVISALKYSTLGHTDEILTLMKEMRSSKKLSTFHENIIIKRGKVFTNKDGSSKEVFTFSHPENANGRCEMAGRCGFILKVSKCDKFWADELTTDPKDYEGTSRHYHDIITAQDMFRYTVMSGKTKDGIKVRVVGRWIKWWEKWFPGSTEWKIEEELVAYNVADYRVSKCNEF